MGTKLTTLKKIKEASLKSRYLILIGSVLFLIFTGTAFITVYQNAGIMIELITDDFNQQQLIIARQIASRVDNILQGIKVEIECLKQIEIGRHEDRRRNEIEAVLLRNRSNGLVEIGLLDNNDRVIERYAGDVSEALQTQESFTNYRFEQTDSVLLGIPQIVPEADDNSIVTVVLYTTVPFGASQAATLYTRLNVSSLLMNIAHNITSGKTGYSWVIDETGTFLFHPEKEFVGKDAFLARMERKPLISFSEINQIMKEKMLRGEEGTGTYISGWHQGIDGEITKLIAFAPIESTILLRGRIWSVAVVAPISEVAEVVHTIYTRHFTTEFYLIAGLFIFGILAVVYHFRMSETLRNRVKRTEADLVLKEKIYQKIVDRATDLIYMFDLEERIILVNQHCIDVFSELVVQKPEEIEQKSDTHPHQIEWYINRKIGSIFSPSDVTFLRKQINTVLEKKTSFAYRHKIKVKGRLMYLNTKLVPIRDDKGQIYQILGISRDVTERMELDQRIYNMEKLASIGTLAAGLAHEINNPLAIILGFTDLLIEKFPEDSPEHKDLKIILEQGSIAKQVVENLLGFARITEGLQDIVDINQSLKKVINVVGNTLKTKKIELVMNIPPDLPKVRCDVREFQQVVFNLVNNAIAAMEKQEGTLTLSAKAENSMVSLYVKDTGAGIPDEIKPLIFDPFFTTKKGGEGTGLGLSLCYGIVKKYGGNITFTSVSASDEPEMESGSTFIVSLPIEKIDTSEKVEYMDETTHSGG
ncbi:ATP-binding protein [candidate division KSB1 bacterium]